MNKKLIAIAVAAAFAAPLAAQAETTIFGKVHMNAGTVEVTSGGTTTTDNFQVNSHASRLGFKGSHDLDGGMKANYHLEYGVNQENSPGFTARNQWIGLGGNWGEFRIGRHDTPLKMSQGKFDQFGDTFGDFIGPNSDFRMIQGDLRIKDAIAYIGKFGGLTIAAAVQPGEGDGKDDGDGLKGDGIADTTSVALMYSAGPLFVSVAQDSYDTTEDAASYKTDSLMRATMTYKMGTMQVGLVYESGGAGGNDKDKDIMGLSFGMGVGASNKVKLQYLTGEDAQTGTSQVEQTQTSVGFDHKFNKQTTGYVMYTAADKDQGATSNEFTHIGVGMIVNF